MRNASIRTIIVLVLFTGVSLRAQTTAGPTNPKAQKTYQQAVKLAQEGMDGQTLDSFKKADKQDGGQPPDTSAQILSSLPTDPEAILDVGSKVNGLGGRDISSWHLKATYQEFDSNGKPSSSGIYEEFWVSDKSYKRSYTSPTFTQTEYATERGLYRSGSKDWPPLREVEVRMYLIAPIPAAFDLRDLQAGKQDLSIGAVQLQCVTLKSLRVIPVESAYCFEQNRPMLRLCLSPLSPGGSSQILYNGVVQFQEHLIAHDISATYQNKPVLTIHVDEIDALPKGTQTEFTPPPDAAGPLVGKIVVPAGTMGPFLLSEALPVYPDIAKQTHIQGTVNLHIVIGKDGVVTRADAIRGPGLLRTAAADAVRKWVYRPFIMLGEPTEVEYNVSVVFTLGNVSY